MPHIRPFTGYLIDAAHATEVVSPAYDAVSPQQRREFADAHPRNYINTMRLQEDFAPEARPDAQQLLARNKAKLTELLHGDNPAFHPITKPCLFIYRLTSETHTQTGLVCEVSVDEYQQGHLKKHENTRSDKEDLLTTYQQVVGVSSSPICLAYPAHAQIQQLLTQQTQAPPTLDFTSPDGVSQQVWRIQDPAVQNQFQQLFAQIKTTYLTDGHHRAASGLRYAQMKREQARTASTTTTDAAAPHNQLLVALFSTEQLNLLPFHRVVRDLGGLTETQFIEKLHRDFSVQPLANTDATENADAITPRTHGEFAMLLNANWYRLQAKPHLLPDTENNTENHEKNTPPDPVQTLDVSILQNHILQPLLGIRDARSDPRLDYVSGTLGTAGLAQKCAQGWAIGFACHATSITQLMQVADAGQLMPPKSTYFDPKARSGIFIREK